MDKLLKKRRNRLLLCWLLLLVIILVGIALLWPPGEKHESIQASMLDGVLHETNRVRLWGMDLNPALLSAYIVTAVLLLAAAALRIFAIPRFQIVPGKLQIVLEALVGFFSDMADKNSGHRPRFVGAYLFSAGVYIFFSTIFELFGLQAVSSTGVSITLPAPISDINAAIAMGFLSYAVILGAGLLCGGVRGGLGVLKDFSLPISMSFRLFGALLSGLLVTELVYYYVSLSFVVPVLVGVLFTLLHAAIQAYVLATLVSIFYGEATEPRPKKLKMKKKKEGNAP